MLSILHARAIINTLLCKIYWKEDERYGFFDDLPTIFQPRTLKMSNTLMLNDKRRNENYNIALLLRKLNHLIKNNPIAKRTLMILGSKCKFLQIYFNFKFAKICIWYYLALKFWLKIRLLLLIDLFSSVSFLKKLNFSKKKIRENLFFRHYFLQFSEIIFDRKLLTKSDNSEKNIFLKWSILVA